MPDRSMAMVCSLFLLLMMGCGESAPLTAKAVLVNSQGQKVGEATFSETPQGVKIALKVENLPPGLHACHIHEKGVCSTPDFLSAGGHFNPLGKKHGLKNPQGPHAGDLPNLSVGTDGRGSLETVMAFATL
ncbi:MAG: superoxide dismutase family protein, partial [Desulfobaccales bacterium]|nr:superoxide dismutase family protein [Desulfobaccales bacterium]